MEACSAELAKSDGANEGRGTQLHTLLKLVFVMGWRRSDMNERDMGQVTGVHDIGLQERVDSNPLERLVPVVNCKSGSPCESVRAA